MRRVERRRQPSRLGTTMALHDNLDMPSTTSGWRTGAVAAAAAPGAPPVPPRGCSWCPCAAYSWFGRQATLSPLVRRLRAPVAVPSLREEGGGVRSRVRAPDHFRGRLRGGRPSRRSALHARCAVVASPASLTRASRSALGRALARGARASQPFAHALQRLC